MIIKWEWDITYWELIIMLFWVLFSMKDKNIITLKEEKRRRQKYNYYDMVLKHNLLHYVLCFDIYGERLIIFY